MKTECTHLASDVGRLRDQVKHAVDASVKPAFRVWTTKGANGIAKWRQVVAVIVFGGAIAPRDILAIADATVCGTERYGVVLTPFAVHVRDKGQSKTYPWGSDLSVKARWVHWWWPFEIDFRVNEDRYTFKTLSPWTFGRFVRQLSYASSQVSLPASLLRVVDAVNSL